MAPTLREDLFFCLTDRCAIFLDLNANRYFGLTGSADLAFRRIITGDVLDSRLEQALEPLRSKGLLLQTDAEPNPATRISPPDIASVTASLSPARARRSPALAAMAISLRTWVAIEMRLLGLKAMIHKRRARKCAGRSRGGAAMSVERIAGAHLRADELVGGANRCLIRSLALVDHLARHGHFPQLVIGVRTGGFSAHCWIQQETMVLNDEVDRVRLFTPIFVL